ncbi:hypothetical protein GX586_14365 [bacterium]|nr:hypothetical protein [bacterium]
MNCDGSIDTADIDGRVAAVADCDDYYLLYPNCNCLNADINGDGEVNTADLDAFAALVVGYGGRQGVDRLLFTYDAENRLTGVSPATPQPGNARMLVMCDSRGMIDEQQYDVLDVLGGDGLDGRNNTTFRPGGGALTMAESDRPMTTIGMPELTVFLALRIRRSPRCPCDYQNGQHAYAAQNLDNDGNEITKQQFRRGSIPPETLKGARGHRRDLAPVAELHRVRRLQLRVRHED